MPPCNTQPIHVIPHSGLHNAIIYHLILQRSFSLSICICMSHVHAVIRHLQFQHSPRTLYVLHMYIIQCRIMSRSLGDVVLSFSPLQVAEYLLEKGHLQPLSNPVSKALQAHSLDLSLPVTSFCYQDSEKKSRKVHT